MAGDRRTVLPLCGQRYLPQPGLRCLAQDGSRSQSLFGPWGAKILHIKPSSSVRILPDLSSATLLAFDRISVFNLRLYAFRSVLC